MAVVRTTELRTLFLAVTFYLGTIPIQDDVVIKQGRLRGTTLVSRNGRHFPAFLGIPYAQPPVGQLRFKNPLPAKSWKGVLLAFRDANQCPQNDDNELPTGDEDCLYLNVYTPQVNPSVLYPTMVYIHGGAFVTGNATSSYVNPGYIMDKNVVLVTMSYRLGVLGFLSTGDAQAPGNFGLKDQTLALRWVQENIRAFGGDPKRVTIFGQSAGAVSVNLHVLSDLSDGLFHQYIAQSGSSLCFWGFREISTYKDHATKLGEYLNCPTYNSEVLIDCLRDVDVYSIVDTNAIFDGMLGPINTWVPTNEPDLDGAFLTKKPMDLMLQDKMKDYPSIIGDVSDEGLVVTGQLYRNSTLYDTIARDINGFLLNIIKTFIGPKNAENLASNVVDFYFTGIDPYDKDNFIKSLTNVITDTSFLFPTIAQLQVQLQQTKSPFYYYSFEYRGMVSETITLTGTNENIGVTHTDELIYLFRKSYAQFGYPYSKLSAADEHILDLMVDFWTSFASTGIPTSNHTNEPNIWKRYDEESTYLRIGHNTEPSLTLLRNFQDKRMHFWVMRLLHMIMHVG